MFRGLQPQPPDALLSLIAEFQRDPRDHKIDLGVGMFRNEAGITPVMRAVKAAEKLLLERQTTKGYLGSEGDATFVQLLRPIVFGERLVTSDRLVGVQTPGGTGAVRLAADLIAASAPQARVWLGLPTWPNYRPLLTAARLQIETYQQYDVAAQRLNFDRTMDVLRGASPGDVVVLQGCCNNPTGADFDKEQWTAIAELLGEGGLIPLLDFAYQGLGRSLTEDAAGLRIVLDRVGEALIAYSCDKNFGVYRERVGALFALGESNGAARVVYSNLLALARGNWSMPPDHGAAVVRVILESDALTREWKAELESMQQRIAENRARLAAAEPRFASVAGQRGMFSVLPIKPDTIKQLKEKRGIYMAGSGRINVAGFRGDEIERFVGAVREFEG
jgi:aromatic-amino-acid transaminase